MKSGPNRTALMAALPVLVILLIVAPAGHDFGRDTSNKRPQSPTPGYSFASGTSALGIPFQLSSNFVVVQARVNNSQPLWFIFASASTSVVDTATAKRLGLSVQNKEKLSATAGDVGEGLIHGVSLALPGITAVNLTVAVLPLDFLSSILGERIAGIIGFDFISQLVVEVDYAGRKLNIYAPPTYRYSGSGEVLALKFIDNQPFITAKITIEGRDAVEGMFEVETADSGILSVERSFSEAHQLLKSAKDLRLGHIGGGEGTMSRTLQGRVKEIKLGRFAISNPIVSFSQTDAGKDAAPIGDGQLGGAVFRRFRVILDYSRRRMILEPNEHFFEPVEADMSGFELVVEGEDLKTLTINEVLANSPASEAGVKEEDELTAINGRPVANFTLEQIRQMLKQEGKEVALSLKRGSQTLQVKLKLRRLI
jgi:hypothetical protein